MHKEKSKDAHNSNLEGAVERLGKESGHLVERVGMSGDRRAAETVVGEAIGGLRGVLDALESRDARINDLEKQLANLKRDLDAEKKLRIEESEAAKAGAYVSVAGEAGLDKLESDVTKLSDENDILKSEGLKSEDLNGTGNVENAALRRTRMQGRAASSSLLIRNDSVESNSSKKYSNVTTEVRGPGLQRPQSRSNTMHKSLRERSMSDDGMFFSPYYRLARVCSLGEEGNCIDPPTPPSAPTTAPAPPPGSETTTLQMGLDSLQSFQIEVPDSSSRHAGYRLLTCNDQYCTMQQIPQGRIHIPHITKTLVQARWMRTPRTVFIVKKPGEPDCAAAMLELARYLTRDQFKVTVVAEKAVFDPAKESRQFVQHLRELAVVQATHDELRAMPIDFCVTVGGDGTIIWLSHVFPRGCPPVLSIHMGSLGFLSTFGRGVAQSKLRSVMEEVMVLTLRMRLEARILPAKKLCQKQHQQNLVQGAANVGTEKKETKEDEKIKVVHTVLNEVVVDRGPESSIINCDLYIGNSDTPITHVQGDGIIISTPTGSTAYGLSAGGSMVHPAIPCVAITPICPHSLSFRPIIIPDTSQVRIKVSETARTSAWVSFDGRDRHELKRGESVVVAVSEFPVPCICNQGESEDWFSAIKEGFNWNERTMQKAFHDPSMRMVASSPSLGSANNANL